MNRFAKFILSPVSAIFILSGCGGSSSSTDENNGSNLNTTKVAFPTYVDYNCTQQENPDSTMFCIKADDSYVSIGLDPSESDIKLLQKILTLFPRRMRERVVEIEFRADDIGEGSASVSPLDKKNVHWEMWVNTTEGVSSKDDPLEATIAHELEHYLTLNSTQEHSNKTLCSKEMVEIAGVCPTKSSLYYDYIQKFWVSIYDKAIWNSDSGFNDYYESHEDDFVTPYAVTNSGEDIAETFSFFLFEDEPTSVSKIKDKKIKYFWSFPELVTLRSEIRNNLEEQ